MKTCRRCRGQKKVPGMGWMEEECIECDGLGKVPTHDTAYSASVTDALDDLATIDTQSCPQTPTLTKPRGRPKK